MKKSFILLFLAFVFVLNFAVPVWSDTGEEPCTIMHPDSETLQRWIEDYERAPKAYIDRDLEARIPPQGSLSLLGRLDYIASQRNQGSCGNCWAWAGTGVLGIALDVQESIFNRLSVQYINSCMQGIIGKSCCDGGWLSDFANFYSAVGQAIPWSNTNANWQDGDASCDTACGSISTSPNYAISSITDTTIPTHGVGKATAIANIKNILNQNKGVWFSFFLCNTADWNTFRNFWWNQGETAVFNFDYSCDKPYEPPPSGGGHAVLCVGYNDNNPSNRYWIMLNSWGTAGGGRPNGLFRVDMDMDYDCHDTTGPYYMLYWQTLNTNFEILQGDAESILPGILIPLLLDD